MRNIVKILGNEKRLQKRNPFCTHTSITLPVIVNYFWKGQKLFNIKKDVVSQKEKHLRNLIHYAKLSE